MRRPRASSHREVTSSPATPGLSRRLTFRRQAEHLARLAGIADDEIGLRRRKQVGSIFTTVFAALGIGAGFVDTGTAQCDAAACASDSSTISRTERISPTCYSWSKQPTRSSFQRRPARGPSPRRRSKQARARPNESAESDLNFLDRASGNRIVGGGLE